ncbi:class I SAM-dependent methyltransferase [Duganella sp. LX20W]|uniref:Class I SAM-dependent methyltransferase n=1 Tax=Rugamonas brunnea TaxID=2758569 RepID=A0A7W2IC30_9BURK|nr:class I SAM-dependent methyltransferase [Rugamonas brunnea]MBA5637934.1 class I SAM-dependent methyltransferase [Rugamonas brunnea]
MNQHPRFTQRLTQAALALSLAALLAPATALADPAAAPQYASIIASPLRTADDVKGDAKRKPAVFLAFAGVQPGMKVLDVAAGGGSTSQLLALAVGSSGEVWAQGQKANPGMEKRLAEHPQANLHPVLQSFDNPVPAGAPPLDLVTLIMNYHDIVNLPTDRAAMNKHIYDALKPGGHFIVIDNAAKAGSGLSATNTLHRIDEATLVDEVTKAGFTVEATSDYLRVPSDPREQPFFKMDGKPDDKFAIRFVKK